MPRRTDLGSLAVYPIQEKFGTILIRRLQANYYRGIGQTACLVI